MAGGVRKLRARLEFTLIPLWLGAPLMWLGVTLTVLYPFEIGDVRWRAWVSFGLVLVWAVYVGLKIRRRYSVIVLERSERGVVYWVRRVNKHEAMTEEKPSPVVLPR